MLIAASFVGGLFLGFWEGINQYYRLESLPSAVIDTGMYRQLSEGKLENPKSFYQLKIDQAIDNYIWLENNSILILPFVFLKEHIEDKEDYIDRLVVFRRQFPNDDISHLLEGEAKDIYVSSLAKRNEFISTHRVEEAAKD